MRDVVELPGRKVTSRNVGCDQVQFGFVRDMGAARSRCRDDTPAFFGNGTSESGVAPMLLFSLVNRLCVFLSYINERAWRSRAGAVVEEASPAVEARR